MEPECHGEKYFTISGSGKGWDLQGFLPNGAAACGTGLTLKAASPAVSKPALTLH